jgi:hypothetical protein
MESLSVFRATTRAITSGYIALRSAATRHIASTNWSLLLTSETLSLHV